MAERRDFDLPDLGEGLTEAEVVRWLVAVGEQVEVDQPIAELSTEKAEVQVPTPFSGVVRALHARPGETVRVGRPLITVDVPAGGAAPTEGIAAEPAPAGGFEGMPGLTAEDHTGSGSGNLLVGYGTASGAGRRRRAQIPAGVDVGEAPAQPLRGAPAPPIAAPSSPLVRRTAAELGVDLTSVAGSGPQGSVTATDLERHLAAAADATDDAAVPDRRVPLRGARRITAERLSRSHAEVPSATAWLTADATGLLALRDLINALPEVVHVTPLAVLLRLCVTALQRHPGINASYDAERGETILSAAINLGVATQTERGLMVPVIRDAQRLSIVAIASELNRLASSARDGHIDAAELRGGTFTVSNFGALGVDGGIAIINPPEAAILGCGRISPRPWAVDGAVVVRPAIELSLAFDHRCCDGADAAGFLRLVGDLVEHPELALG